MYRAKRKKQNVQTEITTLRLSYIEYWKVRRGARLDKLILCPLEVEYNKKLEIFTKKLVL